MPSSPSPLDRPAGVRERLEAWEDEKLSPLASRSALTRGRPLPELRDPLRTEFQRDRDRIIHTNAFRRLKHKTQVFVAPIGDHFVTRLTHTLEVTQIARTIARSLRLNEDLVEAASLGHDVGHTPFGHIGEQALDRLHAGGFRHNEQSLRVVDTLEKDGRGLNLTYETRQAILHHSKPRGNFLEGNDLDSLTLEAQVVRMSDAIAYLAHDINDAIRAGVLGESDLPADAREILGTRHSQRIDTMVRDVVEASWACAGFDGAATSASRPRLAMSADVSRAVLLLREFMFDQVYLPAGHGVEGTTARVIVEYLYDFFLGHPTAIPERYFERGDPIERVAIDYIAGMTDQFAIHTAEGLKPGISEQVFRGRV
ncbi:MAG: deoxyguanosinetriphosphate triphosphohydrolase [SAR202 cluster bacterium]|nr:deoxyguanosinetriphosphate triphosphohydrolase [SAR202 cluster bacterium]